MRHVFGKTRVIVVVLVALAAVTQGDAATVVVPNAFASAEGNFFHDGGPVPVRVMQIYDASQFASLSGPFFITGLSFRPDTIPGPSGPRSLTSQIYASTSSRSVAGLSTTFAENTGADNTLVFNGTQTWSTANLPAPGNTRQFDIVQPLSTPFLYDPRAGNLVLDFQISGAAGSAIRRDAVSGNATVNFVASVGSATAPTGNVLGFGFVTEFTVEPVPYAAGDFDEDGVVDAADYVVWRKGLGPAYTQNDYNVWRANFGRAAGSGATLGSANGAVVPEPATQLLAMFALLVLGRLWKVPPMLRRQLSYC
jgi:hypothetical protein